MKNWHWQWKGFFADFYNSGVWVAVEMRIAPYTVLAEFSLFGYTVYFGWSQG